MEGSESSRSRSKRDTEERTDARESSRIEDDDDWDGSEKRKHRSIRSRKHSSQDEVEEQDSGRRKSSGDRGDARKKSGTSSRAGSHDKDDYDARREESRSKIPRRSLDERGERRASEGYRDRDLESSRKSRDEEHDWNSSRKPSSKPSGGQEGSQGKSASKVESSYERDHEKGRDNESRYSDKKESSRDKDYGRQEQERNPPRRRADDGETGRRAEESNHGDRKASDHYKHGNSRERSSDIRNEYADARSKAVDSSGEKGGSKEDKRADGERSHGRPDLQGEDGRATATPREAKNDKQRKTKERLEDIEPNTHWYSAKSYGEKAEKPRRDDIECRERPVIADEDAHGHMRDRSGREIRHARRSRSPERSVRYHKELDDHDRGFSESDNERNLSIKGKDRDKENYSDDRSARGKDSWEGSNEHWRRSHPRQVAKDGDSMEIDHAKEWDSQRHDKESIVSDKLYGRSGYRKENRLRPEGMKGSSSSMTKHDNSDSIEIKPNKNFDFGREESVSTFPGRRTDTTLQQDFGSGAATEEDWGYPQEERFQDDGSMEQGSGRNSLDSPVGRGRGQKGAVNLSRTGSGQSVSSGLHPSSNSQGPGSFNRSHQSGQKGGRPSRGRGRPPGRDSQRSALPLPMMPPPFNHHNLPPGPMQPGGPNLTHSSGPPLSSNVFISPFRGPLVWPGPRGVDMSMLGVPPNLPPIPSVPGGPRFVPNIRNSPSHPMFFNQQGSGRGVPANLPGPLFNPVGPIVRDVPNDKPPSGWGQTRNNGPSGKAPSRGEQNDYSQNFVDTGMRPQNFIRELELTSVVEDYPKLRELIQRKDEIVAKSASRPMYYKCDLKEHVLSPEFFGTKFDVILVDPPWEEYVHRAPGVTDHLEYWTFEEIQNLKIEASFHILFLLSLFLFSLYAIRYLSYDHSVDLVLKLCNALIHVIRQLLILRHSSSFGSVMGWVWNRVVNV